MKNFWKITNITNAPVKVTVCIKPSTAPGVILKPNQFCVGRQQMTTILDKQSRTNKISIEEFDNSYKLDLAKAYDESFLDKAKSETENYVK